MGAIFTIPALFIWYSEWDMGTGFGIDVLPALLGVGYIVGLRIAAFAVVGINVSLADGPVLGNAAACVAFALLGFFLVRVIFAKSRAR
ncbi:MAG: hypothetical protein LBP28_08220 [Coriobacteriales bacterium]|nr:hypothetical protein [Coriobacteriales bacterium]